MGKKKSENTVKVVDKTTQPAMTETDPVEAMRKLMEGMTDEQKAQARKELGLRTSNGPRRNKRKEAFEAGRTALFNSMPEIKGIIEQANMPGPFSVTIGFDTDGNFFSDLRRLRQKYGPRNSE